MFSVSVVAGLSLVVVALASYLLLKPKVVSISVAPPAEASPEWNGKVLDKPSIKCADDPYKIQCYEPTTGRSLGIQRATKPDEMIEIIKKARAAQVEYAKTTFAQRRAILTTLLDFTTKNQDDIIRVCSRDSGKAFVDANLGEILATLARLEFTIAAGERVLKPEQRGVSLLTIHKRPRIEYHPVGVMGCIVSWNYPFHNTFGPMISSLMAGNACVIKCSEHVAWSTAYWNQIIKSTLRAHGINEDLVTLVNGWGDAGAALVSNADKIIFIGSPGVGKIIMRNASDTLTPVVLELGGKDVVICFDDCDYNQVLHSLMRATFQNAGQNCAGCERVLLQEGIYDKLVADLTERVRKLRIGAPLEESVDVGGMTMEAQLAIIQDLVDDAVQKGARLLAGGKQYIHPKYPKGQFYEPTLLADVTLDMRITKEEVFGPVMVIMKFKTEEEALALANSCEFGLGSAVYTLDLERGERVARKLRVGMSNVNDFGINYLCQSLPFGGVRMSGFDRFSGYEGLRGQCHLRSTTSDRFSLFGVRTHIPGPLQYPISQAAVRFNEALMNVLFSPSLAERAKWLGPLIAAASGSGASAKPKKQN
ncbi:Aldehyde/histidinol dehydrogenase [Polychytrium aggregatum]|uniref:Aldehyde/histidinol dehydrogenase n=1 Tax=Polychytrium aggregatum TaxID=110093 RepID=UPI0022FEC4AA|nr:Aldehyde/histidinol dehydrogenase [Polychytrium aggregatum]KAI9193138.1 Aldehyde/histidinol dehydrogenase [Polychytrium aggregatum]